MHNLVLQAALFGLIGLFSFAQRSSADDERPPQPEVLPMPSQEGPEIMIPEDAPLSRAFLQTSRYDVWQYYGVDRFGRFRARVIYSPYGAYYLYNGKPYPWTTTHALDFMPYVVD
jgi:hypothetical protein